MKVYIVAIYNYEKGRTVITEIRGVFSSYTKALKYTEEYIGDVTCNPFLATHWHILIKNVNEIAEYKDDWNVIN